MPTIPAVRSFLLDLLQQNQLAFVLVAVSIIGAIALHEYAHALAADLQGDRMPRAMGRLTLNPARHLDPLGTLAIFLVGFGWGKPVEFRLQALSSQRFGAAFVALAGPGMNLFLALAGAFFFGVLTRAAALSDPDLASLLALVRPARGASDVLLIFLSYFAGINVLLAVFNLIPLPPLDGSRLLTIFLPRDRQGIIFFLDRYGFLILLALVFLGGLRFLGPIFVFVRDWVFRLAGAG